MVAGRTSSFALALFLSSTAAFASGFHRSGTVCNPHDLAPRHSGTVYGLMNTFGSVAGL